MNRSTLVALGLSAFTFGCVGLDDDMSATEALLVSSISGAEDAMSGESGARMTDDGSRQDVSEGGDRSAAPPMFRTCDSEGTFIGLMDAYDTDESGMLDGEEPSDVQREHGGESSEGGAPDAEGRQGPRRPGPRDRFLHLLRIVYDTDMSGQFEDAEMSAIFDDFTARCEAIHADVLATYDVDGDGELSESEEDTAREGHIAQMKADRSAVDECREAQGGPPTDEGRPEPGEPLWTAGAGVRR
jgi:hypothetical protein